MRKLLSPGEGKPGVRRPGAPKGGAILPFRRHVSDVWRHFWLSHRVEGAIGPEEHHGTNPNSNQPAPEVSRASAEDPWARQTPPV